MAHSVEIRVPLVDSVLLEDPALSLASAQAPAKSGMTAAAVGEHGLRSRTGQACETAA
jgi:hypothetical protein